MQLVTTRDGSHTLYVPHLDEHYHSTYGAITESRHVFIDAGFLYRTDGPKISVLEVGFGTGLNALLTCITARDKQVKVTYHALEKFPVDLVLAEKLNYTSRLPNVPDAESFFAGIHQASWNATTMVHPFFYLHKIRDDLTDFQPEFMYDLVFFDAFAPEKQPEMWTQDIFNRLYNNLSQDGILTTYCVKGTVKRMLKTAGFRIEKLPGPPGKREMLRGTK
ncbi:MAG: tRNA (5-methylaminomethyl-2-thiouridine)(34)-methyltransferase MnmD [Bacteroidales bacterium]|nr:tRNA (5-methylaminomethyl-2-thiouridine)(34)-methyltransferase MnmD [Bacteroidales bacterium]